jgi:hypothetical protein
LIRRVALAVLVTALALTAVTTLSTITGRSRPAGATTTSTPAYWLVASDGGIFSFGGAHFYGSTGNIVLNKPIVGMAATPGGAGYWMVASDGGIFAYGDAQFYGSTGNLTLNKPVVGMTPTPDGGGYWLVASDGGIFSFGDARFYGSTGNLVLNKPVVGMAATPDGKGYWLVASDGGVFAFGDAVFWGSTGNLTLNKPVIGMLTGPGGQGYFLVASDGGMFSFGSAPFFGSLGGIPLKNPIVAAATTPDQEGYWMTDSAGLVSNFGDAPYYGSAPSPLNKPIVGMASADGTGAFVGMAYPSGSYGYDISTFQCGNLPSGDHTIGIVQVDGGSSNFTNPCLSSEVQWAGAGLNLYTFLSYTTSSTDEPGCNDDQACNAGYQAGVHAFDDAQSAGADTNVAWWLDVEPSGGNWSSNQTENMELVQGAITALHETEGIADVGIYASPDAWNTIVGDWQPDVPYWMADWTGSGPTSCGQYPGFAASNHLPSGPLEVVQFDSPSLDSSLNYDEDYAC